MNQSVSWRGVHFRMLRDVRAQQVIEVLPKLADIGVNVIIAEVDYGFGRTPGLSAIMR